MVRTRNQRKGKLPRRRNTPKYAGTGVSSNPVCIEEENPTTIIMDPVPISQVPFEEVQEHQNPTPGNLNLTVELNGDFSICLPSMETLGNNVAQNPNNVDCVQEKDEHPITGDVEPSSPLPLSDKEQRKRRRSDPYEGADPRAKKPNDFPISARLPRRNPNIPPPRQSKSKKHKGKTIDDENWVPEEESEGSDYERIKTNPELSEKKNKKYSAKEKGKQKVVDGTEVVDNADLSKLPKPYSSKFLTKENSKEWDKLVEKKIISQKLLVLDRLENHEQISEILTKNQLLGSVLNIDPYEELAVKEFYCNLTNNTITPSNPMYGNAYLRGKFYEFNPEIINEYLGTSGEEQSVQLGSEQVAQELTAGNVSFNKNKIKAASLTSKYAILQKIALVNWMPSLHESTVKWSLAELLYKIGKGIKINLGAIIHTQITNFAENGVTKASLIFPSLIYSILSNQGLKTHDTKVQVKTLNTTMKLKKGTHQNDLKASVPADNPTDQETLIKYFEKRLNELEDSEKQLLRKHMEIKEERAEVLQWLKALKSGNKEEEDSAEKEEESDQEGVGASVSTTSASF